MWMEQGSAASFKYQESENCNCNCVLLFFVLFVMWLDSWLIRDWFVIDLWLIRFKFGQYVYRGRSDKAKCDRELSLLLPNLSCSYQSQSPSSSYSTSSTTSCSFDNVYQPPVDGDGAVHFLAFSNFFYALSNTAKLLALPLALLDLPTFANATDFICTRSLEQLKQLNQRNNATINDKFLINQCFSNVFIITLLSRYGFKDFSNLKATDNVLFSSFFFWFFFLKHMLNSNREILIQNIIFSNRKQIIRKKEILF